MKTVRKHLQKLQQVKRRSYHPLIHEIHKRHRISKKTLFYVKEYGPHSNVPRTILRESIKILLFASIVSSFGGFAMEQVKTIFVSVFPLVILLPVLNDMTGDYGTIVSSRFSAMLHEGRISRNWWADAELKKLFVQLLLISMVMAFFSSLAALLISSFSNYNAKAVAFKIFFIVMADVALLVTTIFLVSVVAGLYFYRKGEDPNNFLIPITTSVADFGNMVLLSVLVITLF